MIFSEEISFAFITTKKNIFAFFAAFFESMKKEYADSSLQLQFADITLRENGTKSFQKEVSAKVSF